MSVARAQGSLMARPRPGCPPALLGGPSVASNQRDRGALPADVLGVLVAGGCAGVLAWAVATPMDVIKSRLQADGQGQRRYPGPPALRGDQRSGGGAEGALQGAVAQLLSRLPRQHGGLCHLRGRAEAHAGPALIAGAHPPGPTCQQLPEAAGAGGGGGECRGLGPWGPSPRLTTRRSRGPGLA